MNSNIETFATTEERNITLIRQQLKLPLVGFNGTEPGWKMKMAKCPSIGSGVLPWFRKHVQSPSNLGLTRFFPEKRVNNPFSLRKTG